MNVQRFGMAELLARFVESKARWRMQKANQYSDDQRNMDSAVALFALARAVRNLPEDDPDLEELRRLGCLRPQTGEYRFGRTASSYAVGVGFNGPAPDVDVFIMNLCQVAALDDEGAA